MTIFVDGDAFPVKKLIIEHAFRRHINMKIMRGGGKIKGYAKGSKKDDTQFVMSLNKVINQSLKYFDS
ncbi:MAG: hypothetical protein N4A62_21065 [Marinisporobacter sp.]|jgi:uncharacterized protein YaiI (UPF0178 family)|nr:hypothetical protein [Marinisporobacter sp.]